MTDYTELVTKLRSASAVSTAWEKLMLDVAAAIEDMAKHITEMHERVTVLQIARGELEAEVKRLEPKRGEWIEDTTTYAGPGLSNYKCSLCGKICGTWRRGLEPSELPNWCGNCGADMRAKMEVQDA